MISDANGGSSEGGNAGSGRRGDDEKATGEGHRGHRRAGEQGHMRGERGLNGREFRPTPLGLSGRGVGRYPGLRCAPPRVT
jgi:hypothetical protein